MYEYVCINIGTYVHVKKGKVVNLNLNQKPHSKRRNFNFECTNNYKHACWWYVHPYYI